MHHGVTEFRTTKYSATKYITTHHNTAQHDTHNTIHHRTTQHSASFKVTQHNMLANIKATRNNMTHSNATQVWPMQRNAEETHSHRILNEEGHIHFVRPVMNMWNGTQESNL